MTAIPRLYRGDSLPGSVQAWPDPRHRGRTFAEHYLRAGLMAKSADHGLGVDLNQPLPYLVAAHIGYERGTREERVAKHSPLISFSTDEATATYFRERTERKALESCSLEAATHFVWRLDLPELEPTTSPGCSALSYRASTTNVDRFREAQVARVLSGDENALLTATITQVVHDGVRADSSIHTALVIDAVTFLRNLPTGAVDPQLCARAIERASESFEWLVYPTDPMSDGRGYSARLSLNDYLDVHDWKKVV